MKLVLVTPSLGCGGAERILTNMANYWADRGEDVTVLSLAEKFERPFYKLHDNVQRESLGLAKDSADLFAALRNNAKIVAVLRSRIRSLRPDAVISFIERTNVRTLLAARGLKVPVVVAEMMDPTAYPLEPVWRGLRALTYRTARRVVVQTPRAKEFFPPRLHPRISVIPNPVPSCSIAASQFARKAQAVAVGRLEYQKGFDLLLRAFARVSARHPQWRLVILGEGSRRSELERLRDRLGLRGRVEMPGRVKEPQEVLTQSSLFVLPSRYEGSPMALSEAMACGLAVIAADCRSGPREVIRDGVDGKLVPSEDMTALADAMDELMGDEAARYRLSSRAPEVVERFGVEKVMGLWDALLLQIVKRASAPEVPQFSAGCEASGRVR
jgi:glycosyltransferase involved in cell wall biosynthesis